MAGDFQDADSHRSPDSDSSDTSGSDGPLPESVTPSYVVLPTVSFDTPVTGLPRSPQIELTRVSGLEKRGHKDPATVRNKNLGLKPIASIVGNRLKQGKRVDFGDYELIEEIARGGMGVVFRANQKGLNRCVALKVILAGQFATDEDVQRFQSEAEAAAILQHPAIVPIFEVGQREGHHFFSMGLVTGNTLAEAVRESPMMGQEAARIVSDVAGAIAYAHAHGVVHRDLKPSNILLDESARPHVTDFGLAKRADMESHLTGTGQVIGTPNYMAPEQASGSNHLIGPRSDVYSLGAVLYFALTGRPPFHAASMMETLQQVITREPVPPHRLDGSIDQDIETICLKCLQKDPGARYQTAADLQADLERYRNLEPIEARPITRVARGWRWCRRNPGTALLSGALATLTLALAIIGPVVGYRERGHRKEAELLGDIAKENLRVAEVNERAMKRIVIDSRVERGNEAINSDEPATALPFYADALRLDAELGDNVADSAWPHRMRLTSVLERVPEPIALFKLPAETYNAQISQDGKLFAANGRDGVLFVWRISDGQQLLGPVQLRPTAGSSLQFFADGKRLLHSTSSHLQIWNLETGKPAYPGALRFKSTIRSAQVDAAERNIVIGLKNGSIYIHDLRTRNETRLIGGHEQRVNRVDIHSDTNRFVTCSDDGTAMLFNLKSGDIEQVYEHFGPINWVEFDPSGRYIVTASDDSVAQVWRTSDGEAVGPPILCNDRVRIARFDPTGSRIATGSWAAFARVWNFKTGREVSEPMLHENSIPHLEFSPDGKYLLTSSLDHMTRIWDAKTGVMQCPPMLHGNLVVKSFFLPDSRVVTASADGMVRIWRYKPHAPQKCSIVTSTQIAESALSPDATFFVTGGVDGKVLVRDAKTGADLGFEIQHSAEISSIDISSDSQQILTASDDATARLWKAETGIPIAPPLNHAKRITHACFSSDNSKVLTTSEDATAAIWNAKTGKLIHHLKHPREVITAAFSLDASFVVTCCHDHGVRIWETETGDQIGKALMHSDHLEYAAFSPDGRWLITCCRDHTATIWNTRTWQKHEATLRHSGGVVTASFSADSKHVVTGARDGTAKIWRISDCTQIGSPMQVGRVLTRAWYSPCGQFIATAGGKAAQLWDARDGTSLGAPFAHSGWVHYAQFSRDSKFLLSHTDDDAIVWKIPTPQPCPVEHLIERAKLVSGHRVSARDTLIPLTPSELQQLLKRAAQRKLAARRDDAKQQASTH